MKEVITLFDPDFNFVNGYYPQGQVGIEFPNWSSAPDALTAEMTDVINYVGNKLNGAGVNWAAIVALGGQFKDAATKYFNSAAGQANAALTAIFKPSRIYEYGCFNSYWTGGECTARTKKVRIFGRTIGGICYMWAPYTLHCGSTQRCIANCRR